ncbi:hypothetical protein AJ88_12385 [Mesorhizobium amorphae CCBAU 01583]|nr:hypothetical protein AJ88_12385 [Mesorhizobium amorphae CCBAU 01583]
MRQADLPVEAGQRYEARAGDQNQGPYRPGLEQHSAQNDLEQIEGNEWVGRAAAQIQLNSQCGDIEQESEKELHVGDGVLAAVPKQTGDVERGQ